MKITPEQWNKLSDEMLQITRSFNRERDWARWSTSGWRMMSDSSLRELLEIINVEVERE